MKTNRLFGAALIAAAALGLAVSCAKETQTPVEPCKGISTIKANISSDVKVSLTAPESGKGLALAWEAGDQLTVIGNSTETFDIKEGFTAHEAEFEGTDVAGSSFTVIYPGQSYGSEAEINARSYTSQTQTGNGSTAHLEWNAIFSGLDDYSTLNFAESEDYTFKQNGALKFHLQLPDDFSTVEYVSLSASDAIFSASNDPQGTMVSELKLNLSGVDVSESSQILTAYMMVSWNENQIPPGTELTVNVKGEQDQAWTKTFTVGEDGFSIAGGKVTSVKLNGSDWEEPLFWGGSGVEEDPYLIKTVTHLQNMNNLIVSNAGASKLYFKLIADLDMDGVEWAYKNNSISNDFPINFNGNGQTISNFSMLNYSASLFGALKGEVYDLNFKDATLKAGSSSGARVGLLAYRAGSSTSPVTLRGINVNGLTITGVDAGQDVGGLVGYITNGTVEDCHITGLSIDAKGCTGGLVGAVDDVASSFTDCSVAGTIVSTGEGVGGIVGGAPGSNNTSYSGCSFEGSVTGKAVVGGLIGGEYANHAIRIDDCHTTGSVTASDTTNHAGFGSFVGGLIGIARNNAATDGIVITKSWSSADVTGAGGVVGGLVGEGVGLTLGSKSGDTVVAADACEYKTGTVTGGSKIDASNAYMAATGGLVALPRGSYSTKIYGGKVTGAIISANSYVGGIIGHNRKMDLEVESCTVDNGTTITAAGNYAGGILASSSSSTSGIIGNTVSASITGAGYVGGAVSYIDGVNIGLTGNTFNGSITCNGSNAGGMVGGTANNTSNTLTITSCTSNGTITCSGQNVGGIIGRAYIKNVISACKVGGSITSTYPSASGATNAYVGGVIANMYAGTIEKCAVAATITSKGQFVGGVLGALYWGDAAVSECEFDGTLNLSTTYGQYVGGIVGYIHTGRTATVSDCLAAGSITSVRGYVGSAVGVVAGNLVMDDCLVTTAMDVGNGNLNSLGCLIGGSNNSKDQNVATYDVEKCLVWNTSVNNHGTGALDGVMIGQVHQAATTAATSVKDCYYAYDLPYTTNHSGGSRVPADEADLTASPGKARYDGHRAAEGVSCQAKAIELGWSTDVWKLDNSDGYPTLLNVVQ